MLGAFQRHTKAWMVDRVPDKFSFQLLEDDWEKFADPLAEGELRIPALKKVGYLKFVNGPESFTPDNNWLMGETPELAGLFVFCGFNSAGIATSGGAGKYLAEWMEAGAMTMDLQSVDIRRFGPWANNRSFLRNRVTEALGLHYQMAWPNREFDTARDVRCSPLQSRLKSAGACFGTKAGWERPNWFAKPGEKSETIYSFGRQNWFANHAAEHGAARENVAIFDQSGFSKIIVRGRDAVVVLQRLCGANVDVPLGVTSYTGMFNSRGTFETDLTVIRTGETEFYVVTGTAQGFKDLHWIRSNIQAGEMCEALDVTSMYAVVSVMGPNARRLLSKVTEADLSNEAFPFGTSQLIGVGFATARAVRITYVGELGWELHIPVDQAAQAFDALTEAGREFGAVNAGHYAINSLRLEKGYRAFGAELSCDETPLEAGLAFRLDWNKPAGFLGREALLQQKAAGLRKRLGIFVLKDPAVTLWGSEIIWRNGVAVGYTTSGSYGHTVGGAIAMGYIKNRDGECSMEFVTTGNYEIEVNGVRHPATVFTKCPVDPDRKKILA
jgi:4-methylaminobutanoate oxidase (formaldehyde-forming)